MDYLKKNPKLVQLGFVLIGFVILILMTGQYSEIIDVRDDFTKAVERGEIASSVGFSESISMLLSGQLPPQFVRLLELKFGRILDRQNAFVVVDERRKRVQRRRFTRTCTARNDDVQPG
mgnify:CR=1 FL=1